MSAYPECPHGNGMMGCPICRQEIKDANAAQEIEALREVARHAREFYSAASLVMEPQSTEDDHFRFQIAKHDLHESLKKLP